MKINRNNSKLVTFHLFNKIVTKKKRKITRAWQFKNVTFYYNLKQPKRCGILLGFC